MSLDIVTINGVTLTYPKRWNEHGERDVFAGDEIVAILARRIYGRRACYVVASPKGKPLNEFNTVTDALNWIVGTGMVK